MPGMDGIEVCKLIRAESDVPIVMLTAKSDTADVVRGLESGADDYVPKPVQPRVLLVEDLTTDGGSKLSFVDAIRETGASCAHTAVIFYYGIFSETTQRLGDHGVTLHHLCTWWDVLAEARAQAAFDEQTLAEVETFLTDPRAWQAANG